MKNKTKFNCRCPYCDKRDIIHFSFQFDIPKDYESHFFCSKCGNKSKIKYSFNIVKDNG